MTKNEGDPAVGPLLRGDGVVVETLRVVWRDEAAWLVPGHAPRGLMHAAEIDYLGPDGSRDRNEVHAALTGLEVTTPDGARGVITGVESHATLRLGVGSRIGLLVTPR